MTQPKVREITIKIVVDAEDGPAMDAIGSILQDQNEDWLVETVDEDEREATDEEAEFLGFTDLEGTG